MGDQPEFDPAVYQGKVAGPGFFYLLALGSVLLMCAVQGLNWLLNDKTELLPSHPVLSDLPFALGFSAALLYCCLSFRFYKHLHVLRRGMIAFASALIGFSLFFVSTYSTVEFITNRMDFPPAKTQTFPMMIRISRAYQLHGRSPGWEIQTMPVWSNMNITQADYNFMLTQRRPGDQTANGDEINSRGWFCASVMVQATMQAIRVLHAGSRKLPEGTVVLCPPPTVIGSGAVTK